MFKKIILYSFLVVFAFSGSGVVQNVYAQASPILTNVTVSPSAPTIPIGGTVQLTSVPTDQNGSTFIGATTTYTSGNVSVATVDSNTGLVRGVSAGIATITAKVTSGTMSVSGVSSVTVSSSATSTSSGLPAG